MRHLHVYVDFQVKLIPGFESAMPPFVPRASYSGPKNEEIRLKEIAEWPQEAGKRLDLTYLSKIECLTFDFEDESYDTLLAVATEDARRRYRSFELKDLDKEMCLGLQFFQWLNKVAQDLGPVPEDIKDDPVKVAKWAPTRKLTSGGLSFRGHEAARFRKQARFEVMKSSKDGFDKTEKCLVLAADTYERKSVLSGRKDEVVDFVSAIGLSSKYKDSTVAGLDVTLQLFRRAGLCPPVKFEDKEKK